VFIPEHTNTTVYAQYDIIVASMYIRHMLLITHSQMRQTLETELFKFANTSSGNKHAACMQAGRNENACRRWTDGGIKKMTHASAVKCSYTSSSV
jgi:hypothetical protein